MYIGEARTRTSPTCRYEVGGVADALVEKQDELTRGPRQGGRPDRIAHRPSAAGLERSCTRARPRRRKGRVARRSDGRDRRRDTIRAVGPSATDGAAGGRGHDRPRGQGPPPGALGHARAPRRRRWRARHRLGRDHRARRRQRSRTSSTTTRSASTRAPPSARTSIRFGFIEGRGEKAASSKVTAETDDEAKAAVELYAQARLRGDQDLQLGEARARARSSRRRRTRAA